MFWTSIIGGLGVLSHWQVWIAIILYLAVYFAFLMIAGKVAGEDESGGRMAKGCLFMTGGGILHGMLMSLMVAFLLPILLGSPSAAPISVLIALLWPIIKVGVIAIVAVTILCIIPLIGGFIANSPGIQAFLEGVIIFRLLSGYAIEQMLSEAHYARWGGLYPGFWACIGFLIIAGVLVWLITFGLVLISVRLEDTEVGELMPIAIGPVLGVLGGIIPLFMYSSFVRLSIMQLIGS